MAKVHPGRYTAELPDDFVVFLIGMRVNRPLRVHKWVPVFVAMPRMLRYLDKHPNSGLLAWYNAWIHGPAIVQYWRSFEALDRFARAPDEPHLPAWKFFNRAVRASGDVGIWHETYRVRAGEYESIYGKICRASGWPRRARIIQSDPRGSRRRPGSAPARPTSRHCRPTRTPRRFRKPSLITVRCHRASNCCLHGRGLLQWQ